MGGAALIGEDEIARLSGREQLELIASGALAQPTLATTLGFALKRVGEGWAEFEGAPDERMLNPAGTVHGGWAASVLDSALGCAVHAALRPGERYTTLEIKVNLTRTIIPGQGTLYARAELISRGRRTATSEAKLVDAAGKVFAHATGTCLVM